MASNNSTHSVTERAGSDVNPSLISGAEKAEKTGGPAGGVAGGVSTFQTAGQVASGFGSSLLSIGSSVVSRVITSVSNPNNSNTSNSSSSSLHSLSLSQANQLEDSLLTRDLDKLFHAKLRPILDCVDKLRGFISDDMNIVLPRIVVVGDQSSGKSSVLEGLSGIQLPRGAAITTRVPLILRLVNLTPNLNNRNENSGSSNNDNVSFDSLPTPYATISASGQKEEKISLDHVAQAISDFTKRLAGSNVAVSNTPIMLTVYRPMSPDLTIIDLPGITRNPIGDQPKDIEKQIKNMINSYISPPESIILAVMPASLDLVTCECRRIAREVDPDGKRTIAVITKIDQVEKEKGINNRLRAAVDQLGLDLGLVVVKNRAQHENDQGMSWEQAREEETRFFQNHQELSAIQNGTGSSSNGRILLGTSALASLLTTIQEQQIRAVLPRVRKQVGELLNNTRLLARELPQTWTTEREARNRFDSMLGDALSKISKVSEGDRSSLHNSSFFNYNDPQLNLPARLLDLYKLFDKDITGTNYPSRFLTNEFAKQVEKEMRENVGTCLPNVTSPQVVTSLIHKELVRINNPAYELIEQARVVHLNVLTKIFKNVFAPFPKLADAIIPQLNEFIQASHTVTTERLQETIAQENDVFTAGSWYEDVCRKIKSGIIELKTAIANNKLKDGNHTLFINELRLTLDSTSFTSNSNNLPLSNLASDLILDTQINVCAYILLSNKRLLDKLCQLIRYHFTRLLSDNNINEGLRFKLQNSWSRIPDSTLCEYMKEASEIKEKRDHINNTIIRLEKAIKLFEAL